MNSHQLLAALREAGVRDTAYGISVQGLVTFDHVLEAAPILVQGADGQWTIESWERGEHRVEARFDAEGEACAYLYGMFVRP
ncbi:hypothetical protein C7C46_27940 [Streptomyces tateyamensis]|uniref:Uncharacterized protein n=1 Tax=Streptomyces tateyamensis TaxID=565073 RepID=A0A2V4MUT9_9ACTN|nr:hypothetical protein [Streptomyces tateyamensis]PYC69523.1 hypothetical protein C7C46_27940 [Streptomyces tateyamensis]